MYFTSQVRSFDALYYRNIRPFEAMDEVIKETVNYKIRFICDDWLPSSATRQMFPEFQSALLRTGILQP